MMRKLQKLLIRIEWGNKLSLQRKMMDSYTIEIEFVYPMMMN